MRRVLKRFQNYYCMLALVLVVLVVALVFLVRMWPRRTHKILGVDTWAYLLEARAIRENRFKIPKEMPGYLVRSPYDVPPFFYYLVALFPKKTAEVISRFFSPLVDSLQALLLFALVYFATGNEGAAFGAGVLFAVTPVSVLESITFTARPFASMVFTLFLVAFSFFASTGNAIAFIASAILALAVFLTHKMTAQALAVVCVGFFLAYSLNVFFIAPLVIGFVLAVVVSGGYYLRVLRGHLAILNFWRKRIDRRYSKPVASQFVESVSKLLLNPWLLLAFVYYLGGGLSGFENAFFVACAALFVFAVATALKPLAFLGENYRYLEYCAFPSFFLSAVFIARQPTSLNLFLAAACLVVSIVGLFFTQKKIVSAAAVKPELLDCLSFVGKRKENNVLALPPLGSIVPYMTGKKIFAASSPTVWEQHEEAVFSDLLLRKLPSLIRDYEVQLVIVEKTYASKLPHSAKEWKKVFTNGEYSVYKT